MYGTFVVAPCWEKGNSRLCHCSHRTFSLLTPIRDPSCTRRLPGNPDSYQILCCISSIILAVSSVSSTATSDSPRAYHEPLEKSHIRPRFSSQVRLAGTNSLSVAASCRYRAVSFRQSRLVALQRRAAVTVSYRIERSQAAFLSVLQQELGNEDAVEGKSREYVTQDECVVDLWK